MSDNPLDQVQGGLAEVQKGFDIFGSIWGIFTKGLDLLWNTAILGGIGWAVYTFVPGAKGLMDQGFDWLAKQDWFQSIMPEIEGAVRWVLKLFGAEEWLDKTEREMAINLTDEQRSDQILAQTGSEILAQAVTDDTLWAQLVDLKDKHGTLLEDVNGGFLGDLLLAQPQLMGRVINELADKQAAAIAAGATNNTPAAKANAQRFATAVSQLITNTSFINSLRNPTGTAKQIADAEAARDVLINAIDRLSGNKFAPGVLGKFVLNNAFDNNGNFRAAEFEGLLNTMLSGNITDVKSLLTNPELYKMLRSENIPTSAFVELLKGVQIDAAQGAQAQQLLAMLQNEPSVEAFRTFIGRVEPAQAAKLVELLSATNEDGTPNLSAAISGTLQELTKPGNEALTAQTLAFLKTVNEQNPGLLPNGMQTLLNKSTLLANDADIRASLQYLANNGTLAAALDTLSLGAPEGVSVAPSAFIKLLQDNPSFQDPNTINSIGNLLNRFNTNPAMADLVRPDVDDNTYPMLQSVLTLATSLDPATPPELTDKVIAGLMSIPNGSMQGIKAEEFAAFFAAPHEQNVVAVEDFLRSLKPSMFAKEYQNVAKALQENSQVISRVLADKGGSDFLGKLLTNPIFTLSAVTPVVEQGIIAADMLGLPNPLADEAQIDAAYQAAIDGVIANGPVILREESNKSGIRALIAEVVGVVRNNPSLFTAPAAETPAPAAETSAAKSGLPETDPAIAAEVAKANLGGTGVADAQEANADTIPGSAYIQAGYIRPNSYITAS